MLKIKGVVLAFCLFVGSMFFLYRRGYNKNLNYHFKGTVDAVEYDIKGTPNVTINGETFYLSYNNWDFNRRIQKGDSLEKTKNTLTIRLVKHDSGKVLYFSE